MSSTDDTREPDDYPSKSHEFPEPTTEEFAQFREWVDNPHRYAREWKERTDGHVVAFLCTYAPREILYAGGMLPVRPYGGHQGDELVLGDEYHSEKMFCPFSRDVLTQGILGRYDYTDGVVLASTCLALRQTYQSWTNQVAEDGDFAHYFVMPHGTQAEGGSEYLSRKLGTVEYEGPTTGMCPHAPAEYLAMQFRELKEAVEEWTGSEITDADLEEAIEVYDRNRRLTRELYEYRKGDDPAISGLEAMEMVKAGHLVDPKEHNELLASALERLEDGGGERRDTDYRLMVVTAENDDRRFMRLVEEDIAFDATVVVEESCVGTRDFWNMVDDDGPAWGVPDDSDPIDDLGRRYANRPPCPSKDWGSREEQLRLLAEEFDVDGALLIQEKRCDLHERDIPLEQHLLEEELDVPALALESDETGLPAGQFKTRVEAFVEQLRSEELDALF
ncbi:2-hydroxyacyl-CoA dehydratase subunit D [Halobacteriaceae archaeon GCM10025711]